jgi:hypothetical protein
LWRSETEKKLHKKGVLQDTLTPAGHLAEIQSCVDQVDQTEKGSNILFSGAGVGEAQGQSHEVDSQIQEDQVEPLGQHLLIFDDTQAKEESTYSREEEKDYQTLNVFVEAVGCGEADVDQCHTESISEAVTTVTPTPSQLQRLRTFIKRSWSRTLHQMLVMLGTCWLAFFALQMAHSTCEVCSPTYWGTLTAQIVLMPLFCLAVAGWFSRNFLPPSGSASQPDLLDMLVNMQLPDHELASQAPKQRESENICSPSGAISPPAGQTSTAPSKQKQKQELLCMVSADHSLEGPLSLKSAFKDPAGATLKDNASIGSENLAKSRRIEESPCAPQESAPGCQGGSAYNNRLQFLFIQVAAFMAGLIGKGKSLLLTLAPTTRVSAINT